MPVAGAYVTRALLDALVTAITGEASNFSYILSLVIFQFAYLFLTRVSTVVSRMAVRLAGETVVNHIKIKISEKVKTVDLASFDMPEFYERLANANQEASTRPVSILSATFDTISLLIRMASFVVILGGITPLIPVAIVALALPSAIINFIYRRKTFLYIRNHSKDRRQMHYFTELLVNKDGVKEIKILNLADTFIDRYKKLFIKYFKGERKIIVRESVWQISLSILTLGATGVLYLYIAYLVFTGKLSVGDYSLYTGALTSITSSITLLIASISTIYEGTLFIDNMQTFLKEPRRLIPRLSSPITPERNKAHKIEFKNVSFKYPGTEKYVLHNLNFVIEEGDTVVLVGHNGAGKTTLVKLVTRLYDPTEGEILLDGHDLRDYSTESLYNIFGILFQDFGHYAVSAADNIKFGDINGDGTDEDMKKAAKQSGADEFITSLPSGYDTPMTRLFEDDGIEPSIGQWQKLSAARAFYKKSDIIILDEPTASLDPLAEQEIYNQFDDLRKGKTTIFVSHRLSSATTASKIIVLSGGELAELGTHKELMAKGGVYNELFTAQAKRYREN
jgi:ABC-type multidrug transport system fused ATPase/permease subunit